MLKMENWYVEAEGRGDRFLGFAGEHLARRLAIRARVPEYACKLELEFEGGTRNILDLTAGDGLLYTDIRREYVARKGLVRAQVRGLRGEEVIKSNVFELEIEDAVEAKDVFTELVPSEFEQLERTLTELKTETEQAADRAKKLTAKMPLPQGGTWHVWDEAANAYRDSGEPSRGERGETGAQGEKGDAGERGPAGAQGPKGDPFRFSDFTAEQLEALRGPQGRKGDAGEKGEKGDTGERGEKGEKGDTGARGAAGETGPQGPPGERGETGERGPQGEKGDTGEGFRLADQFDSLAALEQAVPEPEAGSAYGVGTAAPYDVYIFSPSKGWVNHGPLQGAKGDTGAKGEKGDPFTFSDFTAEQLEALRGPEGGRGAKGEKGDPFVYADFTPEQLEALRGPQGEAGAPGKGDVSGELFSAVLPAAGWKDGVQTVRDERFLRADAYAYLIAPDAGSYLEYTGCGVYAADVDADGEMRFSALETPSTDLTVNILRLEVPEHGKDV